MRPSSLFCAGLVSVASTLAGVAHAEPSASDRESARTLMNDGDRKTAAKDDAGALASYESAHAIMGVPSTGAAAAGSHLALGHLVEARDLCLGVARYPKSPTEPSAFQSARERCAELVIQAENRIPRLQLAVSGLPAGTVPTVTIDGVSVPAAALQVPRSVNPGRHALTASAPGFTDVTADVTAEDGKTRKVSLSFGPPGVLPGPRAETPGQGPGSAGAQTGTSTPSRPGASAPIWAALGFGAAGIAVGTVTGALSLSRASDAKKGCDGTLCPTENREDADRARTLGNVSNAGFVIGAVGVATGVVLWIVGKRDAPALAGVGPPSMRSDGSLGGSF